MVGGFETFWKAFASFYSIWQACVAQISPFFMAFITGLYFTAYENGRPPSFVKRVVVPSLVFMVGFSVVYALMTVMGLPVGRFLAYNSGTFSFFSGFVILLVALFIFLQGRSAFITRLDTPLHTKVMSALIGVTFALVYSPCITPTLSKVMGVAARPETAVKGLFLALSYGFGLSFAFLVTVVVLVLAFTRVGAMSRNGARVKDISAVILGMLALLNITGYMTHYKAFILGFLVR